MSEMKLKILKLKSSQLESELVVLNHPRLLRRKKMNEWIERIREAQDRVWVTTAYFAPPLRLLAALSQAARRGVDVRLVIPNQPDVRLMYWVHLMVLAKLLESSIRVYVYIPKLLHAKSLIVDGECWLGSSNMNQRSFLLDLEVDLKATHPQTISKMSDQFLKDVHHSYLVSQSDLDSRSRWEVIFSKLVFFVFRRWI